MACGISTPELVVNAFTMLDDVWDWEIDNNADWEIDDAEMTTTPATFTVGYPTETDDPMPESNTQEVESKTHVLISMQNYSATMST